jgi:23S rRNA maturation-related 3'-5' exoribonuclease YhaM
MISFFGSLHEKIVESVYETMKELDEKIKMIIEAIRNPDWLQIFENDKGKCTNTSKIKEMSSNTFLFYVISSRIFF